MQHLGIDTGTSAIRLVWTENEKIIKTVQKKHYGRVAKTLAEALKELGMTGSAAAAVTGQNAGAVTELVPTLFRLDDIPAIIEGARYLAPEAGSIIEIGSQGARFITDLNGRAPRFAVNEHCAGGTGSFFEDQMSRLGLKMEDYSALVKKAGSVPRLSGRCAVFAKTDIIHRQQEGVTTPDILLGLCFAMVRNYKAAIVRNLPVHKPVVFCGGVTRNAGMEQAIRQVFGLKGAELLIPEYADYASALGAAVKARGEINVEALAAVIAAGAETGVHKVGGSGLPVLKDEGVRVSDPEASGMIPGDGCALGIDIGSTSTDLVLTDRRGRLIDFQYLRTAGDPEKAVRTGLASIRARFGEITFSAVGITGSGRERLGRMMGADAIRDEITAQAKAAVFWNPGTDTVFEIGGQDSKYISLKEGEVADFQMNKICAAGTGSFVEEQAARMEIPISEFGPLALTSKNPSELGERCTVFIETAIASAAAEGASREDIAAGLCHSIVRNYLHKVVGTKPVGSHIVLQGGVAYNPGIVAAFKSAYPDIQVSPVFSISGAFGAALLAYEAAGEKKSSFLGFDFPSKDRKIPVTDEEIRRNRDFYKKAGQLATEGYNPVRDPRKKTVGVPLVLIMFKFFPLVNSFFRDLGYNVVLSHSSNEETIRLSQQYAQSETCYPIKLVYGHMMQLAEEKVDYIFLPNIHTIRHPHAHAAHNFACPYMQTAGKSVYEALHLKEKGIELLNPVFDLDLGVQAMAKAMIGVGQSLGFSAPRCAKAMLKGGMAVQKYTANVEKLGQEMLSTLKPEDKVLVLITRNYGISDPVLNMGIPEILLSRGYKVMTLGHLPGMSLDVSGDYPNMYWPFGDHLLSGAKLIAHHPNLYAVYLTNHGCGPDTLISHMFREEMGDKPYLQIEVDEHFSPVGIVTRVEAFLNSLSHRPPAPLPERFDILDVRMKPAAITDTPEQGRKLLIPTLGFYSRYLTAYFKELGIETEEMPEFDRVQLNLGRAETSSKEYLPFAMLLGGALAALEKEQPKKLQFLIPYNEGADADGQYVRAVRTVLDRKGYGSAGLVGPMLEKLPVRAKNPELLMRALLAADVLYAAPADQREALAKELESRAEERKDSGAAAENPVVKENDAGNGVRVPTLENIRALAAKIGQIPVTGRKLAAVGTPMCLTSLDEGVLEWLENDGETILRAPLSEYLWFLWNDCPGNQGAERFLKTLKIHMQELGKALQDRSPFEQDPQELFALADGSLKDYSGGNGRYRFAKTLNMAQGCRAVLLTAPRYENTSMALNMRGIHEKCPAPCFELSLDGDWDEAGRARLKSFLYYC